MKISRLLLAPFFFAAASLLGNGELEERLQPALKAITPDCLLAHIKVLASDEFERRDQIFNGAIDNASGVASVIELAAAFVKINPPPKRSVLFMATTAEEAGLLGAKFNAEHPPYPLEKTLADINLDSMNVWGKARDIEDLSLGFSTLNDLLAAAAKRQGRSAIPESRPDKGKIYRADNFEFSKVGLPSLYIGKGEHLLSRPKTAPLKPDEYDSTDYHQVTDEVRPDWDLSGAVQDVQLLFEVGYEVAMATSFLNGSRAPNLKRSAIQCSRSDWIRRSFVV